MPGHEFDEPKENTNHSSQGQSLNIDVTKLLQEQSVHIQGYKQVAQDVYRQVLDCSGEIYTSSGKIGTANHCAPENVDVYRVTTDDGKGHYALKTDAVDQKHDLTVLQALDVKDGEFKDIDLNKMGGRPNEGDSVKANVYEMGSNTSKTLNGTADNDIEIGQFVSADRIVKGQDINMTAQKIYMDAKNGGSGALVVNTDANKAAGILDYANKTGESVMVPIEHMQNLLRQAANIVDQKQKNTETKPPEQNVSEQAPKDKASQQHNPSEQKPVNDNTDQEKASEQRSPGPSSDRSAAEQKQQSH